MLTLYHLQTSPYAEKARWALDYKGLAWTGKLLFPGTHHRVVRRVSGTSTVPVLVDSETGVPVTDSTDILHHLEAVAPEPPLFPDDSVEHERVVQLEDFFDESVARPVARYNYCFLSVHPPAFSAYFSMGLSPRQRLQAAMVRLLLPRMLVRFRKERELNPEAAARYRRQVGEACDRIEGWLEKGGGEYLVGDRFTAADLTGAAVLGPALRPEGSAWPLTAAELDCYPGGAEPAELAEYRRQLRERPAGKWVVAMWERHRARR